MQIGNQKDQREEIFRRIKEPSKDLYPAIRATIHTEKIDSD